MSSVISMGFQNEFSKIMSLVDSDFLPVKPQGNEGDWKNDVHMPITEYVFQGQGQMARKAMTNVYALNHSMVFNYLR